MVPNHRAYIRPWTPPRTEALLHRALPQNELQGPGWRGVCLKTIYAGSRPLAGIPRLRMTGSISHAANQAIASPSRGRTNSTFADVGTAQAGLSPPESHASSIRNLTGVVVLTCREVASDLRSLRGRRLVLPTRLTFYPRQLSIVFTNLPSGRDCALLMGAHPCTGLVPCQPEHAFLIQKALRRPAHQAAHW